MVAYMTFLLSIAGWAISLIPLKINILQQSSKDCLILFLEVPEHGNLGPLLLKILHILYTYYIGFAKYMTLQNIPLNFFEQPGACSIFSQQGWIGNSCLVGKCSAFAQCFAQQVPVYLQNFNSMLGAIFSSRGAGDPLLVNRQPTLHKPGIMAHTTKVPAGSKGWSNINSLSLQSSGVRL